MWPDQENFIRSHLRLGDEIHLAAAELSLAEKINVRQEETQAYAFTAFLADAGGALGLFLGLSVLQILHWLCSLYYYLLKTFNCFNHSVRQVSIPFQVQGPTGPIWSEIFNILLFLVRSERSKFFFVRDFKIFLLPSPGQIQIFRTEPLGPEPG